MLIRAIWRSKIQNFSSIVIILQNLTAKQPIINQTQLPLPKTPNIQSFLFSGLRQYDDGRPREPLWRSKKLIGKEAIYVILGLRRFKDDGKLEKFIKTHVFRLLKLDMIAVLSELERQEEVSLAVKILTAIRKQDCFILGKLLHVMQTQKRNSLFSPNCWRGRADFVLLMRLKSDSFISTTASNQIWHHFTMRKLRGCICFQGPFCFFGGVEHGEFNCHSALPSFVQCILLKGKHQPFICRINASD